MAFFQAARVFEGPGRALEARSLSRVRRASQMRRERALRIEPVGEQESREEAYLQTEPAHPRPKRHEDEREVVEVIEP